MPSPLPRTLSFALTVQIEPADRCDGSICHQPLFDEDGGLHYVAPHCHLVERDGAAVRYFAVSCDFPTAHAKTRA